jgi:hypothetical protein
MNEPRPKPRTHSRDTPQALAPAARGNREARNSRIDTGHERQHCDCEPYPIENQISYSKFNIIRIRYHLIGGARARVSVLLVKFEDSTVRRVGCPYRRVAVERTVGLSSHLRRLRARARTARRIDTLYVRE